MKKFILMFLFSITTLSLFSFDKKEIKNYIKKEFPQAKNIITHKHKNDSTAFWQTSFFIEKRHYIIQFSQEGIPEILYSEIKFLELPELIKRNVINQEYEYGFKVEYLLLKEEEYIVHSKNYSTHIEGVYYYKPDGTILEFEEYKIQKKINTHIEIAAITIIILILSISFF